MSVLSQLVSRAIGDARIGDGAAMHETSRDRVLVNINGHACYIVCLTEYPMQTCFDGLQVAFDFEEDPNEVGQKLIEIFRS